VYCIVDIETTGGNHKTGRITEIAIYKHDGLAIVDSFTSLVNPETSIPYFISNLTGISNEMVSKAPKFFEIAKSIIEITEGCIFVAHNVGFDYGFLREEFKTLGYEFTRERICTVKSARKAFPGRASYSLGKLCKDIGIELTSHHRADDDARATTELFQLILNENSGSHNGFLERDLKLNLIHNSLDQKIIHALPEETGVYYFLNDKAEIIYVGKSNNIKTRVQSHFRNTGSKRSINMIKETVDIKYDLTGSELIALLQESDDIKGLQPKHNRAQKGKHENYGLFLSTNKAGYLNLEIERLKSQSDPITTFKSHEEAKNKLYDWTERYGLCQKYTGLFKHKGPCFAHQIESCAGACIGLESVDEYNDRVENALAFLEYKHKSFVIIDEGKHKMEKSVVVVENGIYLGFGFIDSEETVSEISEFKEFITEKDNNKDVKRIIKSYLLKRRIQKLIPF